jgi:hypothetical protein
MATTGTGIMTAGTQPPLDERAAAVAQALAEARKQRHFRHYVNLLTRLPLLLHQHGLGQTLAYLQLRGANRSEEGPNALLYTQLTRRLSELMPAGGDDVLLHLTQANSSEYRQLAEEAAQFMLALRYLVRAEEGKT